MKNITFIVAILIFAVSVVYTQTPQSLQDQQKTIFIQPVFQVDDLIFSYNTLNTVEINGGEVDAFVEVRTLFADAIKSAQEKSKKGSDEVTVQMNILTAQNFFNLIARAKITGVQADQYKRVQDAVTTAAKKLKENQ